MAGRWVVDTSVVIALLRGERGVLESFNAAEEVLLPSTVLGELYYGALRASQPSANIVKVDEVARRCTLIRCGGMIARRYADVKQNLAQKGQPIPENDIWIAACALACGLPLVTRDNHFGAVEGLITERW